MTTKTKKGWGIRDAMPYDVVNGRDHEGPLRRPAEGAAFERGLKDWRPQRKERPPSWPTPSPEGKEG